MDTLNHEILEFADHLVFHYAKFDPFCKEYTLPLHNIPDMEMFRISSMLIQNDPILCAESTGPDNPNYEKYMLPAMILHLSDVSNKNLADDFAEAWRNGILDYNYRSIEKLINESVADYNITRSEPMDDDDNYGGVTYANTADSWHAGI